MLLLVTAGPTREYLDSVRFISNSSTGRMGFAVAAEAARRGHQTHLLSGPVELPDPPGVIVTRIVTAQEMFDAAVALFEGCDAAIMAAAVCDYRPTHREHRKLPKQTGPLAIELEPTQDICARLGSIKGPRVVVGFAMEDHDEHAHAEDKLRRKRCDAIVLNGPANIGGDQAEIQVLRGNGGWSEPISGTKTGVAATIVDLVEVLIRDRPPLPPATKSSS